MQKSDGRTQKPHVNEVLSNHFFCLFMHRYPRNSRLHKTTVRLSVCIHQNFLVQVRASLIHHMIVSITTKAMRKPHREFKEGKLRVKSSSNL
jgi:hypothetical protein